MLVVFAQNFHYCKAKKNKCEVQPYLAHNKKMSRVACIFAFLFLIGFSQAQFTAQNTTSFAVDKTSAYCFYYSSTSVSISNYDTYINATSNNLYGYVTVYTNSQPAVTVTAVNRAICTPNQNSRNTCSTENISFSYTETTSKAQYVLVCLECHYWLGQCIFDSFFVNMNSPFEQGYVDCPTECV